MLHLYWKKATLQCEILKSYRPVCSLSFISKLIEQVVCMQLTEHLKTNHLYEIFQSAYHQLHSTGTALLRIQNNLLLAMDTHGGAILVILDLSTVFDTIDQDKLLNLLQTSFGIDGDVIRWFSSYLCNQVQKFKLGHYFQRNNVLNLVSHRVQFCDQYFSPFIHSFG